MKLNKIKSLFFLGRHFALHCLKRILHLSRRNKKNFLLDYGPDRIFAVSPEVRAVMPAFSHCIACRLCDLACPETTPSYFVAGVSRSPTDFHFLTDVMCRNCSACEEVCPEHVPIRKILDFVIGVKEQILVFNLNEN